MSRFPGLKFQEKPRIYIAVLPGKWLLNPGRVRTSLRVENPEKGWQRSVNPARAEEIAREVINKGRNLPNAIVLATRSDSLSLREDQLTVDPEAEFLVIDGQHRLRAQKYSDREAQYACIIHVGLTVVEMAELFLEINEKQKKVPASLRWDLKRLVRSDDEPEETMAADLVYDLATSDESALFQRIDLTGEIATVKLKQASLAPSIAWLLGNEPLEDEPEAAREILLSLFAAMRMRDLDGWRRSSGPLYGARVFVAMLKLLPDMIKHSGKSLDKFDASAVMKFLKKIDLDTLDPKAIRDKQGHAGISDIRERIREQIFA